ncbi:DUF2303 family protein [Pasteurella multocida]|uniref:DUF2303 family protein n=1 Tax=Pasteurella multocida TaxID=747 RepID=UPI0022B2351A|nr:DUF2303 family protein [Pasteurella multocida]
MEKAVNEIAKILANGKAVNSHIPSIILEENFDVKSLESLQENPSRIRTKVSVSSEKSFIEYVNKFKLTALQFSTIWKNWKQKRFLTITARRTIRNGAITLRIISLKI